MKQNKLLIRNSDSMLPLKGISDSPVPPFSKQLHHHQHPTNWTTQWYFYKKQVQRAKYRRHRPRDVHEKEFINWTFIGMQASCSFWDFLPLSWQLVRLTVTQMGSIDFARFEGPMTGNEGSDQRGSPGITNLLPRSKYRLKWRQNHERLPCARI